MLSIGPISWPHPQEETISPATSIPPKLRDAITRLRAKDPDLTTLSLSTELIDAGGAQALAEALKLHGNLTELNLSGNTLGDLGATALADMLKTNASLIALDLDSCLIGDLGIQALAKALALNTSLRTLSLGNNLLGVRGAQALVQGLKRNSSLTTLVLRDNQPDDPTVQALADALKLTNSAIELDLGNMRISGSTTLDAAQTQERETLLAKRQQEIDDLHRQVSALTERLDKAKIKHASQQQQAAAAMRRKRDELQALLAALERQLAQLDEQPTALVTRTYRQRATPQQGEAVDLGISAETPPA